MRARNPWIYAGIAVLALALASLWWSRRGSDSPGGGALHRSTPDGGALHRSEDVGQPDPTRQPARDIPQRRRQFETEVRDVDWAGETEMALRDHLLSAIPDDVALAEVVCKTTACEVTFEAADLSEALVRISEPDSYPPEVIDIVLGGIEPGTRQRVRVIVNVDRNVDVDR